MTARTRGRKRARSPDKNKNKNNSNSNNKKKQKTGFELIELSEYHCCVCKELSSCKIFQCPNGCIICPACYPNLIPCKCPLCRVSMNRNKPIRCRIAERTLGLRLVKCRFESCSKEILFSKLKQHEMEECEYKPVDCKYSILGCKWKGLRQNQEKHELHCELDQNKSLEIAQELSDKLEKYKKFCKQCTSLHCDSIWVPTGEEFNECGEEFFFEGFEYKVHIKSEKKKIRRNQEIYEIFSKISFVEDVDQLDIETIDIDIGIILEPHGIGESESKFMKESKIAITREISQSEWSVFEPQLSKDEYIKMFRGGFGVRVFCFGEEL